MMLAAAPQGSVERLWDVLTFRGGYNTSVVLAGTIMLGVACGVIGSFLLLRRRSLVADALAHAALPGVCVGFLGAVALGATGKSVWALLPSAALFSLLGVGSIHALGTLPRVKEDAAIGVVLSVFFAGGIVLLSVIQSMATGTQAGLKQFIFGQAATMSGRDAMLIAALAAAALAVVALLHKELRLLCFDADFASGLGWSTALLDAVLLAMVTTVTVAGLYAVGAILMVALLIIPPAAARFWTQRLAPMLAIASAIGAAGCAVGTAASAVLENMPTGPAIVAICSVIFTGSMVAAPKRGLAAAALRRIRLSRRIGRQHLLRAIYEQGEVAGDPRRPAPLEALLSRRSWSRRSLSRQIRRLCGAGEIERCRTGYRLTGRGIDAAARVVRTHRLWEFYLATHADVARSHLDHWADDIEHVLGDDLVARLESTLRAEGALPEEQTVPGSPHALEAPEARQ
jgi:manganese/zinc/iron transport system permease protein